MMLPQGANQRWSLDFVSDTFADGRRFRILAIVDDFTRECLALVADTSLPGLRVARELDTLVAARGRPAMIVSDNGTELTGMTILRWSQDTRVEWHYIAPGKPAAERLHRELQRPAARRTVERDAVRFAQTRAQSPCDLDGRLQHRPPAQRPWQPAASHLRQTQCSRNATGWGAALCSRASRPIPLHHRANRAQINPRLYPSLDETWGSGQQTYNSRNGRTRRLERD